ncbi:psbQ-like protein 2, chloroplastic [Dorcoceras hygrometricum]|uniref:PsbQ-like protein 2, chloroplastic n=1 Tax=Dorcoceras hygrometricum TaxID=472368 RepID=A0A2Z7A7E2_9LAMI|nr:psbQ-like protein 2, chloroplastic [Dorcoceras hygrometricum]
MATAANSNAIFETPPAIPKLCGFEKIRRKAKICCYLDKKNDGIQEPSRRFVLSVAAFALSGNAGVGNSMAGDNGFWITGPIPVPHAVNDINNKETGTRSFLKKGLYIANIGTKGRMHRLKRYAFDLIAMGDLIAQGDTLNYVRRYLRLKSTFMYHDFDRVISAALEDDKKSLTDLANRLFDNVEKLESAVRQQNLRQTESFHQATVSILEEVMSRMA